MAPIFLLVPSRFPLEMGCLAAFVGVLKEKRGGLSQGGENFTAGHNMAKMGESLFVNTQRANDFRYLTVLLRFDPPRSPQRHRFPSAFNKPSNSSLRRRPRLALRQFLVFYFLLNRFCLILKALLKKLFKR
jgi:hypothetical protein